MGVDIAFWILAVISVMAALAVVLQHNVFRSAIALILFMFTVAGIYVTLSADFLAVVQVLVYVGAISVLIILAVMLTKAIQYGSPPNRLRIPALITAFLFLAGVGYVVLATQWQVSAAAPVFPTTEAIAGKFFGEGGYILVVEITAVLLLAAVLGAIILVREKKQ